jgi:hypothetical protein
MGFNDQQYMHLPAEVNIFVGSSIRGIVYYNHTVASVKRGVKLSITSVCKNITVDKLSGGGN